MTKNYLGNILNYLNFFDKKQAGKIKEAIPTNEYHSQGSAKIGNTKKQQDTPEYRNKVFLHKKAKRKMVQKSKRMNRGK